IRTGNCVTCDRTEKPRTKGPDEHDPEPPELVTLLGGSDFGLESAKQPNQPCLPDVSPGGGNLATEASQPLFEGFNAAVERFERFHFERGRRSEVRGRRS